MKQWCKVPSGLLKRILGLAIAIVVFGLILLGINRIQREDLMNNEGRSFEKGVVTEVLQDNLQEDGSRVGQQKVKIQIKTGEYKGKIIEAVSTAGYLYGADCKPGVKVIVTISAYENVLEASVYNYDRGNVLYAIIGLFFVVLWLIGGKKGLLSVVGLIFTFVCIIWMFLPLVYRGVSPIVAAAVVSVVTTVVVMYLIGGFTKKSICAMAGTVTGVVLAALFAFLFGKATHISGENVSDIENLLYIGQMTDVKVGELMFAGVLISALGAVMDVAISVTSSIWEIHQANPKMNRQQLFASGMNVGKDMMGTMSNTLILAFAGSSINTLVSIYC